MIRLVVAFAQFFVILLGQIAMATGAVMLVTAVAITAAALLAGPIIEAWRRGLPSSQKGIRS